MVHVEARLINTCIVARAIQTCKLSEFFFPQLSVSVTLVLVL